MPIYAYKCSACGHAQGVLQKLSDPPLTVCPACGAAAYGKQVTAAGFQLKGSGWYVTDFRDGAAKKSGGQSRPATDQGGAETKVEPKADSAAAPSDASTTSTASTASTAPD